MGRLRGIAGLVEMVLAVVVLGVYVLVFSWNVPLGLGVAPWVALLTIFAAIALLGAGVDLLVRGRRFSLTPSLGTVVTFVGPMVIAVLAGLTLYWTFGTAYALAYPPDGGGLLFGPIVAQLTATLLAIVIGVRAIVSTLREEPALSTVERGEKG